MQPIAKRPRLSTPSQSALIRRSAAQSGGESESSATGHSSLAGPRNSLYTVPCVQLCMQWGVSEPAILEVSHDAVMLVDGIASTIITGNAKLNQFERILGAGDEKVGRQIMNRHVAVQLSTRTLSLPQTASYTTIIHGIDHVPRRAHCNVGGVNKSRLVWSVLPVNPQQASQQEGMRQSGLITLCAAIDHGTRGPLITLESGQDSSGVDLLDWKQKNSQLEQNLNSSRQQMHTLKQNLSPSTVKSEFNEKESSANALANVHDIRTVIPGVSVQPSPQDIRLLQHQAPCQAPDPAVPRVAPQKKTSSNKKTANTSKKGKLRRPYRFCAMCWVKKSEWVLRSATLPAGHTTSLFGHTNDSCPCWPKGTPLSVEQNRAYAAAFKSAQRKNVLFEVALKIFKQMLPETSVKEIQEYLIS